MFEENNKTESTDRQLFSGIVLYSPVIVSTESFKSALSGVVLITFLLFIEDSLWGWLGCLRRDYTSWPALRGNISLDSGLLTPSPLSKGPHSYWFCQVLYNCVFFKTQTKKNQSTVEVSDVPISCSGALSFLVASSRLSTAEQDPATWTRCMLKASKPLSISKTGCWWVIF